MTDVIHDSAMEKALKDADDTDIVVLGDGVLGQTGPVFKKLFGDARGIVIADGNTWAAAGEPVVASLKAAGVDLTEPYIFPAHPAVYAGYDTVELVKGIIHDANAVACTIGSGSLNDIVKRASDELGLRCMTVCTAASMDGYAAYGSSITVDGFKTTLFCRAPQALIADLPTLAAAPKRCTATGFGDLVEKVPAGADWIVADELGIEPIDPDVWEMVQGALPQALSDPEGLVEVRREPLERLVEGLIMSGLAMQKYRISSRPASGAGHLFSHVWEMEHVGMDQEPPITHGLKVGLGTIASLALWGEVVDLDLTTLDVDAAVAAWRTPEEMEALVRANFVDPMVEPAVKQTMAKYVTREQLRERLELAKKVWPSIVERARRQIRPAAEIQAMLRTVGAFYHPSQLGIGRERFRQTYFRSRLIRSRYTMPDLLFEAGLFEEQVNRLFAPGGFWAERPWPAE